LGTDAQGNNWRTVGYWAKLRASTANQYQTWATAAGVYDSTNSFLAINHSASFGIKYWEIGNETFGAGYYGGGNGYALNYNVPYDGTNRAGNSALSPARYGTDVVAFSQAMKAVDPTVKIGAVVSTPPGDYSWDTLNGQEWSNVVLSKCANNIDFVIAHWYPYVGNNPDGTSLLAAVPSTLPQMINGTTSGLDAGTNAGIRDWINTYRPTDGNKVQIFITEFGYSSSGTDNTTTSAHACFVADAYATWLDLGVTNVDYQELSSSAFLGDGSTRGDAFDAVSILNKMSKPGDDLVSTTSNNSLVRTHAALQADGTVAVMIINDSTSSNSVSVTINGDTMTANGLRYSTNGSDTTALTAIPVAGLGNSFTISVPGRTIYVYLLTPIAQVNAAWNLAGGGSWGTGTNWNWNRAPKNLGDIATLGNAIAGASAALTLDGNRTLSSLTFNNTSGGSYTISPGTSIPSSTLILANQGSSAATITVLAGNHSITAPVEMDSNVTLSAASGSGLNISGPISESGGTKFLAKTGNGILTLSASNTYTGATQINGGVLELTSAGQISASSPISTADGTTLQIDAGSHALGTISGTGTLNLTSGDLTANSICQDTLTLGAGATLTIVALPGGPLASRENLVPVPEPSNLVLLGLGLMTACVLLYIKRIGSILHDIRSLYRHERRDMRLDQHIQAD
jgi:autotransporter-associated beta strand protein